LIRPGAFFSPGTNSSSHPAAERENRRAGGPHPHLRGRQHVEWFEGNFEDYEQDKIRRLGPDAVNPHRMTYKRLTR
jgi:hypothetical protein